MDNRRINKSQTTVGIYKINNRNVIGSKQCCFFASNASFADSSLEVAGEFATFAVISPVVRMARRILKTAHGSLSCGTKAKWTGANGGMQTLLPCEKKKCVRVDANAACDSKESVGGRTGRALRDGRAGWKAVGYGSALGKT